MSRLYEKGQKTTFWKHNKRKNHYLCSNQYNRLYKTYDKIDAGLINMHREGTMNYYYVDADKSCWHGLKELVDHVDSVVRKANNCGYPYFKEEN